MADNPLISIVICTYNRAELLQKALLSMQQQELDPSLFEILIVDNNSTDHTVEISQRFVNKYDHFFYYRETDQGLSHARNRGWKEAKGAYVGYFDDDAIAPSDWLQRAYHVAAEIQPDIFGGPFVAYYENEPPEWLPKGFGTRIPHESSQFLENGVCLSGTNVFFKRNYLEQYGGFDTNFGMKGKKIYYGEETELIKRLTRQIDEPKIYYHRPMIVEHLVPYRKLTLRWHAKSRYSRSISAYTLQNDEPAVTRNFFIGKSAAYLMQLVSNLFKALFKQYEDSYQSRGTYLLDEGFEPIEQLGRLKARYRSE